MPTLAKWQHTWQTLGVAPSNFLTQCYEQIIARYNEPHRYYHTQQHLVECLEKFEELRYLANNPAEIELALWFHDAIYEPSRYDNELLSADWAKSSIITAGLDKAIVDRVYQLVMATQNHAKSENSDTTIIIDVDLAILAAEPDRFWEYGQQIRQEYAFVPEEIFRLKRAEILQRFLAQATIFNTPLFIERYEHQARINIKQAVEQLCPS